ncbi:glycoside hydrolase family 3 C-terminal domain-containing protein [Actinoallomurus vinaceus]|uniref:Glycoside hydrolase family 3 C-terminal domain-containing protein n=1 Tax=Actinoallomurus vinaceus TaxID=1080074 RepID=A0ABP8U7R1_9ACTN
MRKTLFALATSALLLGVTAVPSRAAPARPWMDRSLSPQKRAELLVARMTLDEKVLEIHMLDVPDHPREVAGIERLGIPALKITNGPAGAGPGDSSTAQPATALPAALGMSASWDPQVAAAFGRVAGQEVADRGEGLIEAPGLNITRVPRNGRNFEYLGEDPYLAARMVVPEVRGIQAQGVIAEIKHYAANNQETDRKTINEVIDERALREIYLPAFEAAVTRGRAGAVMCAYPSVNGQFGCENTHQLKDVLRGEWGFDGFVQSDYTANHSTVASALAGLDLDMKHVNYGDATKAAVLGGQLDESVVDRMLVRRFAQMFRFGLFEHPRTPTPIPAQRDGAVARSIAEQSAVLLKNSGGRLPLRGVRSVAVIGPYAGAAHTGGGGSSAVTPLYTVSPVDGIKSKGVAVTYADGTDPAAAAALAKAADVAVVMVGNKDKEGGDRPNLSLPDGQDKLVSAVAAANPRTVVVLKTGGPVLMPWLDQVPAVLEAWYPGEEDGNAVADLLFGDADPSGKLPMTFPKAENETAANTPQQYPGVNGTATYSEGLDVGYRWYDAHGVTPRFPFGYGLSYTTFAVGHLSVSPQGRVATVDVTNTGTRAGADVVQLYLASPASAGEPPRRLAGFAKVTLRPGQTRHVTIGLDARSFSVWDTAAGRWTTVPGRYTLYAGDSSRDLPLHATVTVRGSR